MARPAWTLLTVVLLPCACGSPPDPTPAVEAEPTSAGRVAAAGRVGVTFHGVNLRVAPGVVLEVTQLAGELRSRENGEPPVFDDPQSFTLHADDAEVALTTTSLARLLNDHVFAYDDAPFSDIEIEIEDGRLKQKGKLHKGLSVPFSVEAELSVTADGRVRMHPTSVKALGLPVGGLMKLIHLEIDDLVDTDEAPAVELDDNDFLLSTDRLLDSPRMTGRLTAVRLEGNRIVQVFGRGVGPRPAAPPGGAGRNYLYFHGGTLRFGKLTMHDTDMQLIDADPSDPFDFSPPEYVVQLTAGYSKNLASGGLRVFMPDYAEARGADLRPATAPKRRR